jgi:long-chain acyl-CoA synthetase
MRQKQFTLSTSKPNYFGKGSVEVGSEAPEGESRARRLAITADKLVTQPFEGIDTVSDVIAYSARTHGEKPAMGWRDVVAVHEEAKEVKKVVDGKEVMEKKNWRFFELSDYKYMSFLDVQEAVSELARALVHLGIGTEDVFNVYSQTRYVICDLCRRQIISHHDLQRELATHVSCLRGYLDYHCHRL